jgi:palmitoyltransferase
MGSGYEGKRPRQLRSLCVIMEGRRLSQIRSLFVSILKWLPVIFTVAIIIWSYYAYLYHFCSITVTDDIERVLYIIGYHILFTFLTWAYCKTVFTETGGVPMKFKLPRAELQKLEEADTAEAKREILERFAQDLPIRNRTVTGSIRYCTICQHIKPDRAHHCSSCGQCALKMDHHCVLLNKCVSFTNYKCFLLLLGYNFLYCLFIVLTTFLSLIDCYHSDEKGIDCCNVIVLLFSALILAVCVVLLFCCHCYLVLRNKSTLEQLRTPGFRNGDDKNRFDLGRYRNFKEVFGDNKMTWFLPIFTSLGDGSSFAVRAEHQLNQLV